MRAAAALTTLPVQHFVALASVVHASPPLPSPLPLIDTTHSTPLHAGPCSAATPNADAVQTGSLPNRHALGLSRHR